MMCVQKVVSNRAAALLSESSVEKNQVRGYQSPLYGRRTAQFEILPFTFFTGNIGRWWGTNPETHGQEEIDIMSANKEADLRKIGLLGVSPSARCNSAA